jgi:large subunit ribosomal protein L32
VRLHAPCRNDRGSARTRRAAQQTTGAATPMGLPKRKVSHARQGERRSHLALSLPSLVECSHCHAMKRSHHACPSCGYYDGRQAVELKKKGGEAAT